MTRLIRWMRHRRNAERTMPVGRLLARLLLGRHALRQCAWCGPDGCPLWDWAIEVHRRELAVRMLLGGTLPGAVTAVDVQAALERIR